MFDVVHDDRLFGAGRHEDLDGVVVIVIGALVQRALNAPQCFIAGSLCQATSWRSLERALNHAAAGLACSSLSRGPFSFR